MKKRKLYQLVNGFISRKIFHLMTGVSLAIVTSYVEPHKLIWYALAGFLMIIGFEIIRLKTMAKRYVNGAIDYLLKRKERGKFNGVFWGSFAVLIAALFVNPFALSYAFAVLAFADPSAALVGRFSSSRNIHYQKTLNGSLAFFIAASSVSFFYLSIIYYPYILIVSVIMGGILTLVEMFSDPLDDNFTVILIASILMTALLI